MTTTQIGLPLAAVVAIAVVVVIGAVAAGTVVGRRRSNRAVAQRLTALGSRLGIDAPAETTNIEQALSYLEQVTGSAAEAVTEASADAIRLRRSLDSMPQGVVICDESGEVVYRNARADALMTSRHGDALAAQAVTELLETGWNEGTAERTLDLYGPPRRTLSIWARQMDDGRRPLGVIAVIEDVSERRRLDEIRRDFVANVSHELKTPIGALGLLAETLVGEPDPEVGQRLASRIHTEAFRVSRIIDDLLDLSRIESAATPPREPVQVNLVMAEAVERVRSAAEQRAITIALQEPVPPVSVLGDRRQLVSAMHALLENAVTYSYEGSKVELTGAAGIEAAQDLPPQAEGTLGEAAGTGSIGVGTGPIGVTPAGTGIGPAPARVGPAPAGTGTAPAGGGAGAGSIGPAGGGVTSPTSPPASTGIAEPRRVVQISVVDHGVGIPARDLERIFERFYRVDLGRSRGTGGTGLGLSIVRHVASNHQGRIDVESREGEGSTFTLVLPLHQELA